MKNLLLVILCVFCFAAGYGQKKGNPEMRGKMQQIDVPKSSSRLSPELQRLHEKYTNAVQNRAAGPGQLPSSDALQKFMQIKGDKVLVDFTVKDNNISAAKAELQKVGVAITAAYGHVISGYVPINALPAIEATTTIQYARPSYKPMHAPVRNNSHSQVNSRFTMPDYSSIMPVISQGDTAQLSYLARKKYRVNGDGVKVGILSDSYNNLGTAHKGVTHGELPGRDNPFGFTTPVQVLEDLDSGGTDEGRQMMEIVHDVAPGSSLAFHTAFNGEADFAQGIQDLAGKGCKIIADDVSYFNEPYFQDGIIAQSVDEAKKKGVSYFSAAGNYSIASYESNYRPSNVEPLGAGNGTAHNFSAPGDVPRYAQPLFLPVGAEMLLGFQWSASSMAASGVGTNSDFDIYLTDATGKLVAASTSDNIMSGEPFEIIDFPNTTTDSTFFLFIIKYTGPDPARIKYILYDNITEFYLTNPAIPGILAPTLVGHAKADGAIATGAAFYLKTPPYGVDTAVVEYFSAVGGVANYFDIQGNAIQPTVRKKPNIVAPDGANVSFSSFPNQDIPQDADTYPNFFGTSAATPHAAGVGALMLQAERLNNITPDQVKGVLEETAMDMDDIYTDGFDKGFDFNTGYGFINAVKAVGKVKFPRLYVDNLKLKPLCSDNPNSVRNWEIVNPNPFPVKADWFIVGTKQSGSINVPSEGAFFTTNTVTFNNRPVPNIAVISWKDNFDFPRVDAEFSTSAKCGTNEVSDANSDKSISSPGAISKGNIALVNTAEVYPNPSSKTFRLYLSLANRQPTNIDLYSVDGRKLQSLVFSQTNGVVNIDASAYKPGIYLLNIKQGNFVKTIKLIKE